MLGLDTYTKPDYSNAALLTIDTQRDVLDGQPLEIAGTSAALPAMRRLIDAFRRSRQPIVHVVRLYKEDGSNVDLCRRERVESGWRVLSPGSPGSELAPEIRPADTTRLEPERLLAGTVQELTPSEFAIYKPRWGAFYRTPLESFLNERRIRTLVFAGCNFPNCPRTSVYEASERDFRVVLVTDAVSGLYEQGCREMQNIGVALATADEVAAALSR